MASIWVESLGRNFEEALDLLQAAVQDCTDELWDASMWRSRASRDGGDRCAVPTGPSTAIQPSRTSSCREAARRGSAPGMPSKSWTTTWREMEPWEPPPPFDQSYTGDVHRVWTRAEILGYVQWCRDRVRKTLEHMTDERAATPLPPAHRYAGQPHAWIITGIPGHTIEHASQIRQFVNDCRRALPR